MRRRYANRVEGEYIQKRIDESYFKGYVCHIKMNHIQSPLIVYNGIENICIKDNCYEWFEVYPDDSNYAITIIFDANKNLIEWYFDIAKEVGIEDNIPFEDDLYLDMVILPNGQKVVLDENELLEAFNLGRITKSDLDLAYKTLEKLETTYGNNMQELIALTNHFCEIFDSPIRIK